MISLYRLVISVPDSLDLKIAGIADIAIKDVRINSGK